MVSFCSANQAKVTSSVFLKICCKFELVSRTVNILNARGLDIRFSIAKASFSGFNQTRAHHRHVTSQVSNLSYINLINVQLIPVEYRSKITVRLGHL